MIDLHMHTNYSDGIHGPAELLALVRRSRVSAFAITDHDTIDGYREARKLLGQNDPELVSGVELSVAIGEDDVHMLAYLFDPDDPQINDALAYFQDRRDHRGSLMVEKLRELGVELSFEDVRQIADGSVIGRPHIAETLVSLGKVHSYQEAFDKYISRHSPAYVPKETFQPDEAIRMVHRAGGVAILAHPVIDDMIRHLDILMHLGLDGIEVYHSSHKGDDVYRLRKVAEQRGLKMTGGSDFHGREGRHSHIGSQNVPDDILTQLKQHIQTRRI